MFAKIKFDYRLGFGFVVFMSIVILSLLTINFLAPVFLNADVLLNSIMSLQNVTLFYWGQNRLLNVIPFVLSPISDPTLNLMALLLLSTFVFYALLYVLSILLSKILYGNKKIVPPFTIFLTFVLVSLFVLKKETFFSFAVGHIEYTLSYLLLFVAYLIVGDPKKEYNPILCILSIAFLFVAMGINFSILLPALSLFIAHMIIQRKFNTKFNIVIVSTIISVIIWGVILKTYEVRGSADYASVILDSFEKNIFRVYENILDALNLTSLIVITVSLFVAALLKRISIDKKSIHILSGIMIFLVFWFFLFSNHKWIKMNEYNYRYFFPIFVGFIFFVTFAVWKSVGSLAEQVNGYMLMGLLAMFPLFMLAAPINKFEEYSVFKEWAMISKQDKANISIHAGDYWRAWPSVMYDLMQGKISYGLAYRSKGNEKNITHFFQDESTKRINLYCHNQKSTECSMQLQSYYKMANAYFDLVDKRIIKNDLELLTFEKTNKTFTDQNVVAP